MALIRAFISISAPSFIQDEAEKIQQKFKQIGSTIRWVKPSHLHMTIKFLGNINEEQVSDIAGCLVNAKQGVQAFTLKTTDIGVFPNINYPKVLWIGFSDPEGHLCKLEENIERNLQKIGFKSEDRKFTPHLTIGRIKSFKRKTEIIRMIHKEKSVSCDDFSVKCFNLMKSDLKPSGSEYSILGSFNLEESYRGGA